MSSSTAVSAGGGGGGGVAWQVDLPALASFVLNLGASGLKRFAEAGVDFHTILCMGEISEKCAASNEYRRELSVCRQAQRTESQWLYKLVEIGAATNFVADELLKTRAGENIVALMSAILPVMSESSCDNLLLKLFEACNTPKDKTPGFAQLRSIRRSLNSLARKTQFKDRAFQYHVLSKQLLETDASTVNHTAYESIPSEETAVQVILALSKLVQEDSGLILAYHGLRGSGWVIAYARHVLGLPVCVLRSTSKPVPISGEYQSARVLVYLFEQENKCELLLNCNVQDLFVTKSLDPSSHAGWLIDVRATNVLDSYISAADPLRKGVSVLARSMANSYIQRLEMQGEKPDTTWLRGPSVQGLVRYSAYCLPALRKRVMGILSLLGFDPVNGSDLEDNEWADYVGLKEETSKGSNRRNGIYLDPSMPSYFVAGPAWIKSGLGHTSNDQNIEDSEISPAAYQNTRLDEQGMRHVSFLSRIVEAACLLSFTDWDQNLRLLSVSFLENPASWSEGLVLYESLSSILTGKSSFGIRGLEMTELSKYTMDICIGGRKAWAPDFSEETLLAFQHHGVVFVQNAAFCQTLDLQSCFINLLPGAINTGGEEKIKIYTDSTHPQRIAITNNKDCGVHELLTPVNSFPGISFSTRLECSGENIYLQREALVKHQICSIPSPGITSRALASLYVTKDCNHGYYHTITSKELDKVVEKLRENKFKKQRSREIWLQVKQGLFPKDAVEFYSSTTMLLLEAVDQNGPGQWLAYQPSHVPGLFTVLQRGCCTACTWKRVLRCCNKDYKDDTVKAARIIYGRLAGEDMK